MTETDEAMEASMRGLELHVQGVNSGYADAPLPLPWSPTHPNLLQTPHSHCELR